MKYAIFDMDGTLVDSMGYWSALDVEFLASRGKPAPSPEIVEQIKTMTMLESSALFIREFQLDGTPESVAAEMNAMMEAHYRKDIPLKKGVGAYLDRLEAQGVAMCVASATAEPLMDACLTRLGVRDHFRFLLSCETVGVGKHSPDIYFAAAEKLGCKPSEAAVYEDAIYAVETAKKAGFPVVGVYDQHTAKHWDRICALSDTVIREF